MPVSLFPLYPGEAIDSGRLRLHTVLGMGGYGVVYRAYDTRTHETYAVKWLGLPLSYATRTDAQCDQYYALLRREINAHEVASDLPNVVTLHRTLVDNDRKCFWLVLDLIPGADMFDAVQLKNPFWRNEERTRSIIVQLVDAVANLHARKVYHRDIKPENVLLSTDASTVYLSDFGSGTSEEYASENTGTEEYMSPEQHTGQVYSCARADAWALAVTLFALLTGDAPWRCASPVCPYFAYNMCQLRARTLVQSFPLSAEVQELLRDTLCPEPELRLDIAGIRARVRMIKRFYPAPSEVKGPRAWQTAARMEASAANWVECYTHPVRSTWPTAPAASSLGNALPSSDMHPSAASLNLAPLLDDISRSLEPFSSTLSSGLFFCPSLSASSDTSDDDSSHTPTLPPIRRTSDDLTNLIMNVDILQDVVDRPSELLLLAEDQTFDNEEDFGHLHRMLAKTPRPEDFTSVLSSSVVPGKVRKLGYLCMYKR